jgi:hypothetical protein
MSLFSLGMWIWLLKCDFYVAVKELNAQTIPCVDLRVYRKIPSHCSIRDIIVFGVMATIKGRDVR